MIDHVQSNKPKNSQLCNSPHSILTSPSENMRVDAHSRVYLVCNAWYTDCVVMVCHESFVLVVLLPQTKLASL